MATHSQGTTEQAATPLQTEGERYELIGPASYVTMQPHYRHQATCARIWSALQSWTQIGGGGLALIAPGVMFAANEVVAPDVVWIGAARLNMALGADGNIRTAPDLVVEVLSPGKANAERDRETKRLLYGQRGVQEYWIADWQHGHVEVYRRQDRALELTRMLQTGDKLASPLLPGFECTTDRFFEL